MGEQRRKAYGRLGTRWEHARYTGNPLYIVHQPVDGEDEGQQVAAAEEIYLPSNTHKEEEEEEEGEEEGERCCMCHPLRTVERYREDQEEEEEERSFIIDLKRHARLAVA